MPKSDKETHVDKLWRIITNNKLIAVFIVLGGIVIAIGQFTGALQTILKFTGSLNENEVNEASGDYEEMKTLFNKIHSEYKDNFREYLDYFENDGDPQEIVNQLADLNKTTADDREKLVRKVRKYVTSENSSPSYLMNSDNTYKLLMDYFGFSDTEYIHSEMDKENIFYQRWRTSIKDDIENILAERWVVFFDPGASRPPMSQVEIINELNEKWQILRKPTDAELDLEKLKKYLILHSIRTKLVECQKLAIEVDKSFDELKPNE